MEETKKKIDAEDKPRVTKKFVKLGSFNSMINFYEDVLAIIKSQVRVREPVPSQWINECYIKYGMYEKDTTFFVGAIINNIASSISELSEKETVKPISPEMNKLLSKFEIKDADKNGDTPEEKLNQIRNCLAHAGFDVTANYKDYGKKQVDFKNIIINMENKYIKGSLNLEEIIDLNGQYGYLKGEDIKAVYFTNSEKNLQPEKITKSEITNYLSEATYKKNTIVGNYVVGKQNSLNQDEKDLALKYLKWVGMNELKKLDKNQREIVFEELFNALTGTESSTLLPSVFLENNREPRNRTSRVNFNTFYGQAYAASRPEEYIASIYDFTNPITYANMLKAFAYYTLEYIKCYNEDNKSKNSKKDGFFQEKLINYYDMDGIQKVNMQPTFYNGESLYDVVDIGTQLTDEKNNYENKIKKIDNWLSKMTPDKLPKNIKEQYNSRKKEKAKLEEEKKKIDEEIAKGTTRKSYNNFFRHLRNSLAHGRYEIDYSKAIKKENVDFLRYYFYDLDENEKDENGNPKKDFELRINAKNLIELMEVVHDKVLEVNQTEKEENKTTREKNKKDIDDEER